MSRGGHEQRAESCFVAKRHFATHREPASRFDFVCCTLCHSSGHIMISTFCFCIKKWLPELNLYQSDLYSPKWSWATRIIFTVLTGFIVLCRANSYHVLNLLRACTDYRLPPIYRCTQRLYTTVIVFVEYSLFLSHQKNNKKRQKWFGRETTSIDFHPSIRNEYNPRTQMNW